MDSAQKDEVVRTLQAQVAELQRSMLVMTEVIIPAIIKAGTLTNDALVDIGNAVTALAAEAGYTMHASQPIVRH